MIFFCQNKISYVITLKLLKTRKILIIASRARIIKQNKFTIYYGRSLSLFILFLSVITRIPVIIPHTKTSKILKWVAIYARNLSWIDDGMDTFRDKPKNIDLSIVKGNAKYYTFQHSVPVANWVNSIRKIEVCPLTETCQHDKPVLDLKNYHSLVIESTGIDAKDFVGRDDIFYIKHGNSTKNQILTSQHVKNVETGSNINVENTTLNFQGDIFIGESMVLIYLLTYKDNYSNINVHLTNRQFENLSSIHHLLAQCKLTIKKNV